MILSNRDLKKKLFLAWSCDRMLRSRDGVTFGLKELFRGLGEATFKGI